VPPEIFDEDFYLSYYPDVRAAKLQGDIPSGYYHYVVAGRGEDRSPVHAAGRLIKKKLGDAAEPVALSNVHSISDRLRPLKVKISSFRPVVLNVFVPTLDPDLMFGGYIAFLNFLVRVIEAGHRVRLLVLEDGWNSLEWFVCCLKDTRPRWVTAIGSAEFLNCTRKDLEVEFNRDDLCVAYSTWTMHDATSVAQRLRRKEPLFFIQEYEPAFNANDAFQFMTAAAYRLPHVAIFNSILLRDYFRHHRIGVFSRPDGRSLVFSHALSSPLPSLSAMNKPGRPRRLICYARPEKHAGRNLFEITILALKKAIMNGVFPASWTFCGIGSLGHEYEVDLGRGRSMTIIPKLPQHEYEALLRSFDVGLSLMWAPHPSVLPFEFARAGIVTVTNEYGVRTKERLGKFGFNIVGAEPTIDSIAAALGIAVNRSADTQTRMKAAAFESPSDWDEVFNVKFLASLERVFGLAATRTEQNGIRLR
jgi:beta-1,2-rhamnosyltransferase WsaF-like protein